MGNKINNTYHLPLLIAVALMWIVILIFGGSTVDLQMHDTYLVIAGVHIGILLSLILLVKAFLYYSTRTYPFSSFLCWFEVALTLLLICVVLYFICLGKVVSTDAVALLFLLLGTWMLMQFFIGVNYFLLMFSQEGAGGKSLF